MNYPKLGTKIVLDEEKIIKERVYDLNKIYNYIDELAKKYHLTKVDKYTYMTQGNNQDLSNIGLFTYENLMKKDWFVDNLKEWWWIEYNEFLDLISDAKEFRDKTYA